MIRRHGHPTCRSGNGLGPQHPVCPKHKAQLAKQALQQLQGMRTRVDIHVEHGRLQRFRQILERQFGPFIEQEAHDDGGLLPARQLRPAATTGLGGRDLQVFDL